MFMDYRRQLIEARKELLAIKRMPKYSEMAENQIELEETNMELARLENFL